MTTPQEPANDDAASPAPEEESATAADPRDERIRQMEDELAKMRDQWLRAVAEAENVRKRAERDQAETARYATTAFARDMVSVLENLKRASESIPPEARSDNEQLKVLGEGVDLTLQELLSILARHGIQRIDPMGQKFDHNFHQAVVQVESADVPPGTVVQVVQAGYVMHDRLLRPAMVAVSKQGEASAPVDTTA